jgi:fatty-acyl-CoA synthase
MSGEATPWVDGLTIGEVFHATAEKFPDRDAIAFPQLDTKLTYAEFAVECRKLAKALMTLGVKKGDHVGIWATNWPQWLVTQFGAAMTGAVLVNINPAYRLHELKFSLQMADIHTLLLIDAFKTSDYVAMVNELMPSLKNAMAGTDRLRIEDFPELQQVMMLKGDRQPGMHHWDDLGALAGQVEDASLDARMAELNCQDAINIQFTSGTTGLPKGAMLTHRNLLLNAYYCGQGLNFSEVDRLCIPVPFYHCFGCVLGTLQNVVYGSCTVSPAETFDPEATLEALEKERCTTVYGVPTMFIGQLSHPRYSEFDLSSLRTGIMAGAPCPMSLMKQVVDEMGVREMTIAYGLTEASPAITVTKTTDSLEVRTSTVGRVIPGVEAKIVDPATGKELPKGEQGELWARGHNIMLGYYKREDATAEAIVEGGWLRTGDLATESEDGLFRITGRIKEMLIRGGENVYPKEIEDFLRGHEKIEDVQVVGVPDEKFGEQVSAWIKLKNGESATAEEIKAYCKGNIAHFKIPYYVEFVEEYPMTVTGKIRKFKLRDIAIEKYGLQGVGQ